jgi:hypothetical protein
MCAERAGVYASSRVVPQKLKLLSQHMLEQEFFYLPGGTAEGQASRESARKEGQYEYRKKQHPSSHLSAGGSDT